MTDAVVSDSEREELQVLLDSVPAPLEPLDVSMLDGFLCGVLVQARSVPGSEWLPWVTDVDRRELPKNFEPTRLHQLAQQRHAQINRSITRREWFDPWVFELSDEDVAESGDADQAALDSVFPWVAGFAAAMNAFPALMSLPASALTEPLALLYRHLDPDDLDDADDLLEAVEALAPLTDLSEAVQDLVRATLLLADVGRPLAVAPALRRAPGAAAPRGRRRR